MSNLQEVIKSAKANDYYYNELSHEKNYYFSCDKELLLILLGEDYRNSEEYRKAVSAELLVTVPAESEKDVPDAKQATVSVSPTYFDNEIAEDVDWHDVEMAEHLVSILLIKGGKYDEY